MRALASVAVVASVLAACGGGGGGATGPGGGGGGGGGGGPAPGAPSGTILIQSGSFNPDSMHVAAGTVVTFTNNNTGDHDVQFSGNVPVGGNIPVHSSGSNQRTFNTAGRYGMRCTIHGFTGVIRVP